MAEPGDLESIVRFNCRLASEIDGTVLPGARVRAGVLRVLENASLGPYFLAYDGPMVAGQLRVVPEFFDWNDGYIWWLDNVYTDPAYRNRGVFRALFAHVQSSARSTGVLGLRLHVASANPAKAVYRAAGFSLADDVMECWLDTDGCSPPITRPKPEEP